MGRRDGQSRASKETEGMVGDGREHECQGGRGRRPGASERPWGQWAEKEKGKEKGKGKEGSTTRAR